MVEQGGMATLSDRRSSVALARSTCVLIATTPARDKEEHTNLQAHRNVINLTEITNSLRECSFKVHTSNVRGGHGLLHAHAPIGTACEGVTTGAMAMEQTSRVHKS